MQDEQRRWCREIAMKENILLVFEHVVYPIIWSDGDKCCELVRKGLVRIWVKHGEDRRRSMMLLFENILTRGTSWSVEGPWSRHSAAQHCHGLMRVQHTDTFSAVFSSSNADCPQRCHTLVSLFLPRAMCRDPCMRRDYLNRRMQSVL